MSSKKIETALISAGRDKKFTQGSVNAVIQRASSLVFNTVADKNTPPPTALTENCFTVVVAP